MPTPKSKRNKRSRSSCPDGWHAAGYSVPIHLTVKQQRYCHRALGITRFVYNLCVATHRFCRTNRLPWPSWQDLYKAFNACKREDYPFVTAVASRVAEGAFMDFCTAIKNWRDTDHKAGPPRFHKKRLTGTGSFRAASGISQIKYNGKRRIELTGLGSVKLRHTLPKGLVYEAHIKFLNGQWVVSIKMWQPPKPVQKPESRIAHGAVDTGINPHATDSQGQTWENPKAYYQAEHKLHRWQRAQARRTPGSRGWWEAQRRINRLHRRITGLRRNAQHQMTSQLVHKFQNLVIEDLNVAGMMRGKTPKAQADAGMGEIKRQLIYKGQWHHCEVQLAHRFYPSSKTCSNCQTVNAKLKREPTWQCSNCCTIHDRNINAAVNLRNLLTLPAGSGVHDVKTQLLTDTFEITKYRKRRQPLANYRRTYPTKPKTRRAPTPLQIQERLDKRRQYEANRPLTPERKQTWRKAQAERRQKAKENGLCVQCFETAIPGQTKCEPCRDYHRRRVNAAAKRRKAKAATQ